MIEAVRSQESLARGNVPASPSGQRNLFAVMGLASLASLIAFVQLYPSQQALVAVGPIS